MTAIEIFAVHIIIIFETREYHKLCLVFYTDSVQKMDDNTMSKNMQVSSSSKCFQILLHCHNT